MYNQIWDSDLKNSCSVLAFLDYVKEEYYIDARRDKVVTLLNWLEKVGAFFRLWGADAGVIYPALKRYLKSTYDIDMEIVLGNIKQINDWKAHVLGFKGANKAYLSYTGDLVVTEEEVDAMRVSNGHFVCYKNGIVRDNLGGIRIKWDYNLIMSAYDRGLFYYNTRRFIPGNDKTRKIANKAIELWMAREKAWGNKEKGDRNGRPYVTLQELKNLKVF